MFRDSLDLSAAERQREVLALAPERRQIAVVRRARLRGIARRTERGGSIPVLHVHHEHEGRTAQLFRVRVRDARRRLDGVCVTAPAHRRHPEQRARFVVEGQWMDEIGGVHIAPLPRRLVRSHPLPDIRQRLFERRHQDPVAGLGAGAAIASVGRVRRLHPRDDLVDVVLVERRFHRFGNPRRIGGRDQLVQPELEHGRRHRVAIEDVVPREQRVDGFLRFTGCTLDTLQKRDELTRRNR